MILITKRNERFSYEDIIKRSIQNTLLVEGENTQSVEVSVLLTNDKEIKQLNKVYRGVDSATDVLAFPMREGEGAELNRNILGDIVISIDTARKQSEEVGHPLEDELTLLAVHGILHLLGYDDQKDDDAKIMREKEEKILSIL